MNFLLWVALACLLVAMDCRNCRMPGRVRENVSLQECITLCSADGVNRWTRWHGRCECARLPDGSGSDFAGAPP